MKKKKVWRYYCEFCKKSGCSGGHISTHEKHCTMNPNRECRMCKMVDNEQVDMNTLLAILPDPKDYIEDYSIGTAALISYDGLDIAVDAVLPKLREITGNCPACILAALRQKGIPIYCVQNFDFKIECDKVWADINEANAQKDRYLYGY